jgi:FAD/FMN-containing dehydrogenase
MLGALMTCAVLALASCQLFLSGPFPAELSQVTARVDLSSTISASSASGFNLSILKAGTIEYVLLYSSDPTDSSRAHLVVLSPDLKVLNTYTEDDINSTVAPVFISFAGNSAVAHPSDGTIVIGNVVATPSAGGLALSSKLLSSSLNSWTIVDPSLPKDTWSGFFVDQPTGSLIGTMYASDWSSSTPFSKPLGRPVQLCGVFTDPESAVSNVVILVFSDNNTLSFFQVRKNPDLMTGLVSIPFFTNPSSVLFTKNGLSQNEIFTTSDSIIGYDYNSRSWVRFTPADPGSEARLSTGVRKQDLKDAFSFSGGYYCTWDPDTRTLVRKADWW